MDTRTFQITLTGSAPLLMHMDNIPWADEMELWKNEAAKNKGTSKAGDDRTPAWRWIGCVYHDAGVIAIPADNLSRCIMEAAANFIVAKNKTFKEQTQSGMMFTEFGWPLLVDGKTVAMDAITKMRKSNDFHEQEEAVKKLGFSLYIKRAKVGTSKHIRVRPRFPRWSCQGTVQVWDPMITEKLLQDMFTFAGERKGLCDWRPGGKTPGPFGRFTASVTAIQ